MRTHLLRLAALSVVGVIAACGPSQTPPPDDKKDPTPPSASFETDQLTVKESDGSAPIVVVLSKSTDKVVTALITTPDGDATCEIPAGETQCTVDFAIADDDVVEADEDLTFELASVTNATRAEPTTLTVTVEDDDVTLPSAAFALAARTLDEPANAVIELRLNIAAPREVRVPFTVSGTASSADHTLVDGEFVVAAGETSAQVAFEILDDEIDEQDETIIVTLGTPQNAVLGSLTTQTITINDDDAAPVASFADATLSLDENAAAPALVLTLDRPSDRVVTVPFTVSGTATSADHDLVDGEFTFPAGETSAQVTFALVDDALDEEDETIVVTLGEATNAVTGTLSALTITIADDDDAPSVSFTTDAQTISESVSDASVDIELSAPSGRTITVHITLTADGREPLSGSLLIEPGNTTLSLPLNGNDNEFDQPDRTGVITIDSLENAVAGTFMTHTVTVTDDDPPSVVTFAAAAQTVTEGDGVTALVTLDRPSGFTVEAEYSVMGTATSADHTLVAGKLTFLPGETEKAITFNVIDDDVYEGNETIQIALGTLTHATIGDVPTHTVTIEESLPAVTVSFDAAADSTSESGPSYTLTAKLSGKSAFPVTVPFTVSGTATSAAEHDLVDGEFEFEPGETVASIVIALTGDSLYEQDETVVVTLGTPVNAAVGAYGVFTLTLEDDDAQPMVAFTIASSTVAENAQGAQAIGLTMDGAAAQDVVVTIEVEDAAQATTLASGTVTIPAGQTFGEILFNTVDNDRDGDDKTVVVTLVEATVAALGDKTTHTLTVTDDDEAPTVSFARTPLTLSEGESIDIELSLNVASEKTVTAPFSISSSEAKAADYTLSGTQVTFAPGETSATVTFEAHADDLYEGHQDITFQLDPATNATAGGFQTLRVTIFEATDVPTLALKTTAAKQAEGTTVTLDVELSGPVAFDTSFTWKALFEAGTDTADAADVVISALTGTIAAGQTTGQISFALAADGVKEDEESFRVRLDSVTFLNQNNVLYNLQRDPTPATITIEADPSEPLVTIATDATVLYEGSDTTATFTVTLDAAFEAQTTVALAYSGTAQSGVDFTPVASVTFDAGETEKDVVVSLIDNDEFRLDRTLTVAVAAGAGYEVGTPSSATVTLVDDEPVTKMAGLKVHLDAATIGGVADGEDVLSWTATGELGSVQFDSSGVTDPLYFEASIAGLPSVRFSAGAVTEMASDAVELTSDAATGMTVIVVGKAQLENGPGHFWQVGLSADALGLVANDDGSLSLETESNWLLSDANAVRSDVWALSTTLVGATGSARGSAALFVDGQALGTQANDLTSPAALSGPQRLIIGGDRNMNLLTGEVAEVMFFGRELNDAERGLIECHLSEKYRLPVQGCAAPPYTATITADQETVTEGTDATATFTVTLDRAAAADVVVELDYSGNADPDTDYTAPASVTVPAGQTSTTLEVTLVDDAEDRGERTLTVHISDTENVFAGTPSSASVTIEDDDAEEEEVPPLTNHVVISEFAVKSGSPDDEFVELYNPTNEDVEIEGWKLQYKSAGGASYTGSFSLPVGAVIKAKGYYLVTHRSYVGTVTGDASWETAFSMSGNGGHIRLTLPEAKATDIDPNHPDVVDTVGYGATSGSNAPSKPEGSGISPVHGNSGSFERKAVETSTLATMQGGADALRGNGWDSDNNANDFVVRTTRDPQNSQSAIEKP